MPCFYKLDCIMTINFYKLDCLVTINFYKLDCLMTIKCFLCSKHTSLFLQNIIKIWFEKLILLDTYWISLLFFGKKALKHQIRREILKFWQNKRSFMWSFWLKLYVQAKSDNNNFHKPKLRLTCHNFYLFVFGKRDIENLLLLASGIVKQWLH